MILAKPWDGTNLHGEWEFTVKIDGVRAFSDGKNVTSRAGKPLYNLDHLAHTFTDAEVFFHSFKQTIEVVKTKKLVKAVQPIHVFSLDPTDPRLCLFRAVANPTKEYIKEIFEKAVEIGFEGLVLKKGDVWLKVKAHETFDVTCDDFLEGEGACKGTLGAIVTAMGRVGTGFTDKERMWFWKAKPKGAVIEVECNRLTEEGKFRHASFKRLRWDKTV